jgi:hypothetical protein
MENKTLLIIIATLGIAGLFFLLKKPAPVATGMPVSPVGAPAPTVAPTTCQGRAIALAMQQLGLPESELTVRSLIPQDLGLNTWSLNLATANAWNANVISTSVADNRFLCITGISYSGSAAEQVRVRVGASTVAQFSIEQVPGITTTHHVDISPILAQQNLPVQVDVYASAISAADNVILEGMTVEKRGMVVA